MIDKDFTREYKRDLMDYYRFLHNTGQACNCDTYDLFVLSHIDEIMHGDLASFVTEKDYAFLQSLALKLQSSDRTPYHRWYYNREQPYVRDLYDPYTVRITDSCHCGPSHYPSFLRVSHHYFDVSSDGGSVSFRVIANVHWHVTMSHDSPYGAEILIRGNVVTVTVPPNIDEKNKLYKVKVVDCDGSVVVVIINQDGLGCNCGPNCPCGGGGEPTPSLQFDLASQNVSIDYRAQNVPLTVVSNVSWSASLAGDAHGATVSQSGNTVNVSVPENTTLSPIVYTVQLSGGGLTATGTITQGVNPALLNPTYDYAFSVSPSTHEFEIRKTDEKRSTVTSTKTDQYTKVTTPQGWEIESYPEWLSVVKSGDEVIMHWTEDGTVGTDTGYEFSADPMSLSFSGDGTGEQVVSVTSTKLSGSTGTRVAASWKVTDHTSWVHVENNSTSISVTVDKNSETNQRSGYITLTQDGSESKVTITVTQAAKEVKPDTYQFTASPDSESFTADSEEVKYIDITSTKTSGETGEVEYVDWSVTSYPEWLKVEAVEE